MLAHWRRVGSKGNALRKRELQQRILTAKNLQVGRGRFQMWSPRWQVGRGRDQKWPPAGEISFMYERACKLTEEQQTGCGLRREFERRNQHDQHSQPGLNALQLFQYMSSYIRVRKYRARNNAEQDGGARNHAKLVKRCDFQLYSWKCLRARDLSKTKTLHTCLE